MSGNSSESRRTTSPIRSILVLLPTVALTPGASRAAMNGEAESLPGCSNQTRRVACSSFDEGEPVLADLELVAVFELLVVDAPAVDEGAVERALVLDEEVAFTLDEHRVVAGDGDVVEEDLAVGRAADARPVAARPEALPRPAAARAHDERRPFEALDRVARELADLLGRERLRRLDVRLALLEQRAAARAVVGGFRVLEAALRAVNVRQLALRGGLPREDLRQPLDVHLVEHTAPTGDLEPLDELGAEDVDLAV